jgi:probable rRNA maturation factor
MTGRRPALRLAVQGHEDFADLPGRATLRRWLALALPDGGQVGLRFVGTREGRALNREFRGRDYATNVLTFDYGGDDGVSADIVLCMPVVRREAREQSKPLRNHLAHLLIHGALHARGMDHGHARQARAMEHLERRLLEQLGIPDPYAEVSTN